MLSNTLPIYEKICKRSARFIAACLRSGNNLIKAVGNHGILARCRSVAGKNIVSHPLL